MSRPTPQHIIPTLPPYSPAASQPLIPPQAAQEPVHNSLLESFEEQLATIDFGDTLLLPEGIEDVEGMPLLEVSGARAR